MNAKTSSFRPEMTPESFNDRGAGHLPGLVGLTILSVKPEGLESRVEVRQELMAPNGFLHAASVIALADTSCGYACAANLPQGRDRLHHDRAESQFPRHHAGRGDFLPRDAVASRPHYAGLGCRRDHRGHGQEDRDVPLHADGPLAQVDKARAFVLE